MKLNIYVMRLMTVLYTQCLTAILDMLHTMYLCQLTKVTQECRNGDKNFKFNPSESWLNPIVS